MTIIIGIVTLDTVLLIADGRQSTADEIIKDDAVKIRSFTNEISIATFGLIPGTNIAMAMLESDKDNCGNASEIGKAIEGCVSSATKFLLSQFDLQARSNPRMKVGIYSAGIDEEGPFITGTIDGSLMPAPTSDVIRFDGAPRFVVTGGESANAIAYFEAELIKIWRVAPEDLNSSLPILLGAARRTIAHASGVDPTIGGHMQYHYYTKGHALKAGFF